MPAMGRESALPGSDAGGQNAFNSRRVLLDGATRIRRDNP